MFLLSTHNTVVDKLSRLIVQNFNIKMMLLIILMMMTQALSQEYIHTRELMAGERNKMRISWLVENDLFLFKLSCNTRGFIGLAFSYSDLPLDGFVAGVGRDGDPYVLDLHLDFAGMINFITNRI